MNPCKYISPLEFSRVVFKCVRKDGRCGYHKKGQEYRFSNLTPKGLCPEAYHNLYYASLGILFNAKFEEKQLIVKCPAENNWVVFRAGFEKLNLRFKILNVVKRVLFRLFPGQIYQGRLFWEVIKINGECPRGHLMGLRFYINMGNFQITRNLLFPLGQARGLCPAVFDNFFPYFYMWRMSKTVPCSKGSPSVLIQCPDHKANITFEIKEEENEA